MNVAFLFKKASVAFLLLFCFVVSFDSAEAERAIRVRKVKTHVAPRHISLLARSGNGVYARRYGYDRPIPHYSTKGPTGRNRKYYAGKNGGRRRRFSKTYASRYRNWTDNRSLGGRNDPRIDRVGQKKKRKELLPFLIEPPVGQKQKRRNRPHGLTAMQRPRPPKKPSEFDEDYFFPEEAKRAETKYEFENRYPRPKKKRRPDFEQNYGPKIPFYDEKPLSYKTKTREPAFSYSSFVQHPSGPSDFEELYEESDSPYQQPVRSKKKRVKKKSNSKKKNKDQYKPFVFENDQSVENYPPYLSADEYELPTKSYKKRNKPSYAPLADEDDFVPSSPYTKPRPQVSGLFSTDSDYRGSQNTYQSAQFSPTYSQTWSQAVTTTARPIQYQTDGGFQPQQYVPSQYTYSKDVSALQKTKTVGATSQQSTYYSQPDNTYKNVAFSSTNQVSPSNYVYSQPAPASSPTLTDITIQKSVPIYDNTETFYNFNNNAFVNSQSSKYYSGDNANSQSSKYYSGDNANSQSSKYYSGDSVNGQSSKYYSGDSGTKYYNPDASQNYGNRLSTYRSKDKTDSDSEFMKKHQNLYSKGLTGVPVQGDGYAKETFKKDYDIGYGDFQFDENPSS